MAQNWLGQITDTAAESGDDLADRLNSFDTAHKSNQAGSARPSSIAAGGIWSRANGDGTYTLMLWDGAADRPIVMEQAASLAGLRWFEGGVSPTIGDTAVTNNSIAPGAYKYSTAGGSSGGPATVLDGLIIHMRRDASGGEAQILVPDWPLLERGRIYSRARGGGAWSDWARSISSADALDTADWEAGAGTDEAPISPAKLAAAVPLFQEYVSPAQTITPGGLLTLTHGLGQEPKLIRTEIVCTTAEAGFQIGDKVDLNAFVQRSTGGARSTGVVVAFSATEIRVRFSVDPILLYTTNFSTGANDSEGLHKANWNFIIRAWA